MRYFKQLSLMTFLMLSLLCQAQENGNDDSNRKDFKENIIGVSYSFMYGEDGSDNDFNGNGFEISYAHFLWKDKLYAVGTGGISYARSDENINYWYEDQAGNVRMTIWSIGLGYNFLEFDKIWFSGELGYLSIKHHGFTYSPNSVASIDYRSNDIFAQLKMHYNLSERFVIFPAVRYGFRGLYNTVTFKVGAGFKF